MRLIACCLALLLATPAAANSIEDALCGPTSAPVAQMAGAEKLCRSSVRSFAELPTASAAELRALLTPENLATMAALTSIWLGTQGVPLVGEAVDATLATLGITLVAIQASEVSKALWLFANRALTARTDADLKTAASSLAWAVSKVGVTVVTFVLTKKIASRVSSSRAPPSEPPPITPQGEVFSEGTASAAQANTVAPAASSSGVLSQGTGRPSGGEREPAPTKKVDPKAFADWIAKAPKTPVRVNSPATRYQVKQAGAEELTVSGGGKEVRADGARASDAHLLEVKHVDKPATSPYVPGSTCNDDVREIVRLELLGQLQRYAAIIMDPTTPVVALELITNEPLTVPYLESLMRQASVPGKVVVRP